MPGSAKIARDREVSAADLRATATAPFSITTSVAAGDTIDFVVGYGTNATHSNDSTGLSATITY